MTENPPLNPPLGSILPTPAVETRKAFFFLTVFRPPRVFRKIREASFRKLAKEEAEENHGGFLELSGDKPTQTPPR